MGQEFSKIKFQRQISECVSLNQLLRHIYRGVSIHVIETVDSIESVRFLLLSRYEIFSEKFDDDGSPIVTKEMDMEQFRLFKRYIIELNKLLNLGATLNPNSQSNIDRNSLSEECPICMEVSVEVALPCTHSFCNKCYEDWKSHNPTCPFCRADIISSQLSGGDESWSIEDCDQDMNSIATELYETTLTFIRTLPKVRSTGQKIRIFPPIPTAIQDNDQAV